MIALISEHYWSLYGFGILTLLVVFTVGMAHSQKPAQK